MQASKDWGWYEYLDQGMDFKQIFSFGRATSDRTSVGHHKYCYDGVFFDGVADPLARQICRLIAKCKARLKRDSPHKGYIVGSCGVSNLHVLGRLHKDVAYVL